MRETTKKMVSLVDDSHIRIGTTYDVTETPIIWAIDMKPRHFYVVTFDDGLERKYGIELFVEPWKVREEKLNELGI